MKSPLFIESSHSRGSIEAEITVNDDLSIILLLEDGLDGESKATRNGDLKLDPWRGAQTMVDDRPTTCVR